MSGNKWAVVGVAASVVGVAAIGGAAMAYFLMKEEEDFRKNTLGTQLHVSSRPATIEIQIPQDQAGIVIGRGGRTIKEIQAQTDTKIHFKDEKATNENRYLAITGQPEDVKLAEIMIYQTMANQPFQETFEMNVPSIYVGAIIGRSEEHTLNSSHITISYAVFCLKKKKQKNTTKKKQKKYKKKTKTNQSI